MTLRRQANPKRDGNELELVQSLRRLGCRVLRLSGAGVPDLAVYRPATGWVLAEVKTANGRLTQAQEHWGPEIRVWRSLDDALRDMGLVN